MTFLLYLTKNLSPNISIKPIKSLSRHYLIKYFYFYLSIKVIINDFLS
jgi:hypothetical protein